MKIAYVRPYEGEIDLCENTLPEHTFVAVNDLAELSVQDRAAVEVVSVFVDYQLQAEDIAALPNLKLIATRSAGYDHIDITAAKERDIPVVRVPRYGVRTVAEYAIALMFALARNAYRGYDDMKETATSSKFELYEGFDLAGKTLGVVGTGAIGSSVCAIARGIGMKVLAYDVHQNETLAAQHGVQYMELEELLAAADIVTLHVPSIPETYHLLSEERIAMMKKGAYLINTARGEIVDTVALVSALQDKHLAGAGLDVLENEHMLRKEAALVAEDEVPDETWERLVAAHALIDMPNVIVTPHIAFNTVEAKREITQITLENIQQFLDGNITNAVAYE